jgi:hypothetical protein
MLTQEYLKAHLHYNPETGNFTRIKANGTAHIGDVAGNLSSTGYIYISLNNKSYRAHRLVWLYLHGAFPEQLIDHINGVKHDNRLANLRLCNKEQNGFNSKIQARNKFGLKGVKQVGNRFAGKVTHNYKTIHLGMFATPEEAHKAYLNYVEANNPSFSRSN